MKDEHLEQILRNIGENLYALRHASDQKIETVGRATGVNHSVISKIEHGKYGSLSVKLLLKLTYHYNTDVRDLFKRCSL